MPVDLSSRSERPLAPHKPIVLVVDDADAIRENLGELLSMEGYECWGAPTADAAFGLLQRELRAPDVVLLDLWMPGMPAERFVSLLKEREAWARARVVLITATSEGASLPVDAILRKPFDVTLLLRTVAAAAAGEPLPREASA
jgi:CheY-like chemotaxis protein